MIEHVPAAEEEKEEPSSPSKSNSSASVFNEDEDSRVSDGAPSDDQIADTSSARSVQRDYSYSSTDGMFNSEVPLDLLRELRDMNVSIECYV